jgi:type IV secretion system protein TrbG
MNLQVRKESKLGVVAVLGTTQTLAWASTYYLPAILADRISGDLGMTSSWFFAAFSASLVVAAMVVHILVKPIGADLETNLVIATDRRTYHLEMRSSEKTYMASVSWTYPASELIALKKQRAEADIAGTVVADTGIEIEKIRFRYRIEGDAPWKPRQVFDDGAKVYIQFPSGLAQSEAPPLFVIGPDAKPALVNYRVRGTTYIVDRLFAAAELRLGTAPQQVVRIVRTDAVWREVTQ